MFDWEQYLRLAELLTSEETSEAVHRTAVSRAYYAAFNVARLYVQNNHSDKILLSVDASVHSEIMRFFLHSDDLVWKQIGRSLKRLRGDRNSADYDDELPDLYPSRMSDKTIRDAKLIISTIKQI